MGFSNVVERQIKMARPKIPIKSQPKTEKLKKACSATPWRPKIRPKKRKMVATRLRISKDSRLTSLFCSIDRSPAISEAKRIGNWMRKIERQPKCAVKSPPTVGPIAGATAVISVPTPIMRPILRLGTCSKMMLNMRGRAKPTPIPWTNRPKTTKLKLGAIKSMRTPKIDKRFATRKMVFILNERLR